MIHHRLRILISAVLVLTLLPALRAASRPEDAPGRLEGFVRTASGEALAGVQVSLQSGERTSIAGARTGADGRFVLPDVPPGRYLLVVSAPGFNERRLPAVVGTGTATSRIRTGQMLRVDGTSGVVTIVDSNGAG